MTQHFSLPKRDRRIRHMWLVDDMAPREIAEALMAEGFQGFKGKTLKRCCEQVWESMNRTRDAWATGALDPNENPKQVTENRAEEVEHYAARLAWIMEHAQKEIERDEDEYKIQTGRADDSKDSKMSVRQIQLRKGPNAKRVRAMEVYIDAATRLAAIRGVRVEDITGGISPTPPPRPIGVVVLRYPQASERDSDDSTGDTTGPDLSTN